MAENSETTPRGVKRKRDFFNDEDFSDVIIRFSDKQVFAHKVILARGSLWFDRALSGNFSEANKQVIEIHDDASPEAVEAMIKHLYGSSYENQGFDEYDPQNVEVHLSMFMLGDKYDIGSLRVEAAALFKKFLQRECSNCDYWAETIYAIQKLLGPHAPQLADQSLTTFTRKHVLGDSKELFHNKTFRGLLAEGLMLQKDLASESLEMLDAHFDNC